MAAVDAHGIMGIERSIGMHPFFQGRSIPHRPVTPKETSDDDVDTSLQPAKITSHSSPRKRKAEPLVERAQNTHLLHLPSDDAPPNSRSAGSEAVHGDLDMTPKKKVLKLNSNGKLLSSPPITAPEKLSTQDVDSSSTSSKTTRFNSKRSKGRPAKAQSSSLVVKIGYGRNQTNDRLRIGSTINEVLGSIKTANVSEEVSTAKRERMPKKSTHPFFLDKARPSQQATNGDDNGNGKRQDSNASMRPAKTVSGRGNPPTQKPVAWKDIVFSPSHNQSRHQEALPAPWPPIDTQKVDDCTYPEKSLHCGKTSAHVQTYKSKGHATQVPEEEDILRAASHSYLTKMTESKLDNVRYPVRRVLSGDDMSALLEDKLLFNGTHLATKRLKSQLTTSLTAFDQGKCEQLPWTSKSAPSTAEQVLQPGSEAIVLRDWVKNLAVTSVEGVQPADKNKPTKLQKRRGRPRRKEKDEFVVSSDDERDELTEIDDAPRDCSPFIDDGKRSVLRVGANLFPQNKNQTKNAILISGPSGCGKTASVYAIAKELDFEVFEIHPGTRRGAKEILEKVGDMTQNHLVQGQSCDSSAEEAPAIRIDDAMVQNEIAAGKQRTMNGFFQTQSPPAPKPDRKRKAMKQDDQREESTIKKPKKTQKQSLILLEEVDILFEEDKSFWTGVMSLIDQSKRPIILTCNDESALPLNELPLHGILRYIPPHEDMATDYLLTLAASEGHEIERDAVSYLYRSQRHDLRAAITELDFWCQMGIGSRKGGLDWMLEMNIRRNSIKSLDDNMRPRVFSTNTYLPGMGLTSLQLENDSDQFVLDAFHQLDLPIDMWCAEEYRTFPDAMTIKDASFVADLYSDLDLCQEIPLDIDPSNLQLRIAISLTTRLSSKPPTSSDIIHAHIKKPQPPKLTRSTFLQIFEPLATEKPTFPPAQGRLAPSLDSPISIITTDLAPYIRSIVAYEERVGTSLPVPKRSTRSSARPESHFPKRTNAKHVLMTGGEGWQDLWVKSNEDDGVDME